ncbi:MAG: GntR family transcriptional regulator [Salinivirgaceae bacterium]|nr:GntR family transcriptional regulator [Salinivirgaceae bacterium]
MTFSNDKPIYLQIVDIICTRILSGEYKPNERIPALREFSAQLEVNINTVIRSLEYLQQNEIIYNKRGLGFFVSDHALDSIKAVRRKTFLEETIPNVIKEMQVLGITWDEVMAISADDEK